MTIKYHVKIVNINIYYLVDSIKSMHQVSSTSKFKIIINLKLII